MRVAFFPDSYVEVNGVATTSVRFVSFAKARELPFLCIHAGPETSLTQDGSVTFLSLKRSPLSIPMDEDLKYDPFFNRHLELIRVELEKFRPDVIHLTGLNDVSITAAWLAHKLKIPLVGSWHTNLHEYAARRLTRIFNFLPESFTKPATNFIERKILSGAILYYKMPKIILAPNQELIDLLEKGTGRQGRLMIRGVDTNFYSPAKRTVNDGILRFGFVGRLRAEKNLRLLVDLEKEFIRSGKTNFSFLIVGEGSERRWLQENLKHAEFTGFLDGENLAEAYANMDVFLFPSETDAFGNVIQEANASGAPAIVSDQGGPKFIVQNNVTGFIAKNFEEFSKYALMLMDNPEKLATMKKAAREFASSRSWDAVFESVYDAYAEAIALSKAKPLIK